MSFQKGEGFWLGKTLTPETREKIRSSHLGNHYSPKTEFKKGYLPWNTGKKCPQILGMKGKQHTAEVKEKISDAMTKMYVINPNLRYSRTKKANEAVRGQKRESPKLSRKELYHEYKINKKIIEEIAKKYIVSVRTVYKLLNKYNIKKNERKAHNYIFIDKDLLYQKYLVEHKSGILISAEMKLSLGLIYSKLKEFGILRRSNSENLSGRKLSIKLRKKLSDLMKGKFMGEKSSGWKGGRTPKNKLIRKSWKSKEWREAVFKRDNFTCQDCGKRSGNGKTIWLEAHHIKSFTNYPNSRFDIDNGQTLCKDCHILTDNYGPKCKYRGEE